MSEQRSNENIGDTQQHNIKDGISEKEMERMEENCIERQQ